MATLDQTESLRVSLKESIKRILRIKFPDISDLELNITVVRIKFFEDRHSQPKNIYCIIRKQKSRIVICEDGEIKIENSTHDKKYLK
jgi:hypothetical protein